MKFVESIADIGWTQSGRFDSNSDELALKRAIAGYHAFLDIMAQNPDAFLVPTLVSCQADFSSLPFLMEALEHRPSMAHTPATLCQLQVRTVSTGSGQR